jgi:Ca-activated chloride channel family protein
VGLWSFSSKTQGSGKLPYRQQVPLSLLAIGSFSQKLDGMQPVGATARYTMIRAAHRYMLEHYDKNRINAVVVLTDGGERAPQGRQPGEAAQGHRARSGSAGEDLLHRL